MAQRLDKINKPHNVIGSWPKLEPRHKRTQGPTNIKSKISPNKMGRLQEGFRSLAERFKSFFLDSVLLAFCT